MRDDIDGTGFVGRPAQLTRGRPGKPDPASLTQRIFETAENGKALLVEKTKFSGGWFKKKGYALHQTINGAPKGWVYVWLEPIEPPKPKPPG